MSKDNRDGGQGFAGAIKQSNWLAVGLNDLN